MVIKESVVGTKDPSITQAVDPTEIEKPGSKYCYVTFYNVYGRVTHIALIAKVFEVVLIVSDMMGPLAEKEYRNFGRFS